MPFGVSFWYKGAYFKMQCLENPLYTLIIVDIHKLAFPLVFVLTT